MSDTSIELTWEPAYEKEGIISYELGYGERNLGTQVRILVLVEFPAFCSERLGSRSSRSNIAFLSNQFKPEWTITFVSINRWRKHLDPHLHMLWKVSAQTQSTNSPWQPSLTKALEPSPMTYCRRPCKPVCRPFFSVLFVGWLTKGFSPVKQLSYLMLLWTFTKVNSNKIVCFFLLTWVVNFIFSDGNCIITFELWLCFSQT